MVINENERVGAQYNNNYINQIDKFCLNNNTII